LYLFGVWFKGGDVLFPEIPSFFCFIRKNFCVATKRCPLVVKPYWKSVWTIVMEIEKAGMGFRMVKEGSIPSHPIIIVIKGLWGKWYGKAPFFKWIFPLLSA